MNTIQITGERMIPQYDKDELIYLEHLSRYYFAIQFIKKKRVLDIACGSGYGTNYILQAGAKKVIGVDIAKETVAYCRQKYKSKNLSFIQGDLEKLLPFSTSEFDVIVSMETIEHLHNQEYFIKECKRVLKKNGILIISTPNSLVYPKGNQFHVKEFTPKEFKKLLSKYFEHIEFFYQNNSISNFITKAPEKIFDVDKKQSFENNSKNLNLFYLTPLNSLYQIAVASNNRLPIIHQTQTSFDGKKIIKAEQRTLEQRAQILWLSKSLEEINNSRGWRIIKFLHNIRIRIPFLKHL